MKRAKSRRIFGSSDYGPHPATMGSVTMKVAPRSRPSLWASTVPPCSGRSVARWIVSS